MDLEKRITDLRQTYEENPRPVSKSDWVEEILKQPTLEERRRVIAKVPEEMKGEVLGTVKHRWEVMRRKKPQKSTRKPIE